MGFFSWKTIDTRRSICNTYQNKQSLFTVYMRDDKGNVWVEDNYEGYGEFGGKDYYELLAEMNGLGSDRDAGIELAFTNSECGMNEDIKHPSLNEYIETQWDNDIPYSCKFQGYFYPEKTEYDNYNDVFNY